MSEFSGGEPPIALDQTMDRPNIRAIVIANKEGGIKNDAEATKISPCK